MKRKLAAFVSLITAAIFVFSGCGKYTLEGTVLDTSPSLKDQTETVSKTEAEETSSTYDITTKNDEVNTEFYDKEQLKIINERSASSLKILKQKYGIVPTDFEKKYDENLLFQISDKLNMSFGVEEYHNWTDRGIKVFKDLFFCTVTCPVKGGGISFFNDEVKSEILHKVMQDSHSDLAYLKENLATFSMKKFNDYLSFYFGPDVVKFKASDFETVSESYNNKTLNFDINRPETDIQVFDGGDGDTMIYLPTPTEFGCSTSYIYDITETDGEMTVYTVGESEPFGDYSSFSAFQRSILYLSEIYEDTKYIRAYNYIFGKNGSNVFLKRIERRFLFPDETVYNAVTEKNNVDVNLFYMAGQGEYETHSLPSKTFILLLHYLYDEKIEFVCPYGVGVVDKSDVTLLNNMEYQ